MEYIGCSCLDIN